MPRWAAFVAMLLAGCAGAHLQPLHGEGPAERAIIGHDTAPLRDDAPTREARALVDAIRRGDYQGVWRRLGRPLRHKLRAEAHAPSDMPGREVVAAWARQHDGGAEALFEAIFGARDVSVRGTLHGPLDPRYEGPAVVGVVDAQQRLHECTFALDGLFWRLETCRLATTSQD